MVPEPDDSRGATGPRYEWTHSAFFREYAPRIEALVRARLSRQFQGRFDAADVVQSAFRSFFLSQTTWPAADSDPWPLLVQIAIHKLSRQIRQHSAQRRTAVRDTNGIELAIAASPSPAVENELTDLIAHVQQDLPALVQQVFQLRMQGYEILEIGHQLHLSERTVRRHLTTVKETLQRRLEAEPPHPDLLRTADVALQNSPGLRFDNYRLLKWIGDGAVGNVYKALEKSTGRVVAVKFLKKSFRRHAQALASFRNEVELVARLQHPGIIRITGIGQTPNEGEFLVMDWAPRGDLGRWLQQHRPAFTLLRQWVLELADALQHAHEHRIIHCDLKPANVLIAEDNHLLVSDFGFARQIIDWRFNPQPAGGTPGFMAPELIDPSRGTVGPWTDVFGLGAILFYTLTRQPVFSGGNSSELLSNILGPAPVAWPAGTLDGVPADWRSLCADLLEKDVSRRTPDMKSVRERLRALADAK